MPYNMLNTVNVSQIQAALTFQHQTNCSLDQLPPTDNTFYTILATTADVRLINIQVRCDWTVVPTSLNLQITIDGIVMLFGVNAPGSTSYYSPLLDPSLGSQSLVGVLGATDNTKNKAFILEGRSVKIEAKTIGGIVSALYARGMWAKR